MSYLESDMANLQRFRFSNFSDLALSFNGWTNDGGRVFARGGNDVILGIGGLVGISNGSSSGPNSLLDTGTGNDVLQGIGRSDGIKNDGGSPIVTGAGDDAMVGIGNAALSTGIFNNSSVIDTGIGNDSISGTGGLYGLRNEGTSQILTGDGNDSITGASTSGDGIFNSEGSTTDTGAGADIITGTGGGNGFGITNYGFITTGDGDDVIDALSTGFGGDGTVNLGEGDDELKGFGSGTFDGGSGDNDTITFAPGTYNIKEDGDTGSYAITLVGDTTGTVMTVTGFEWFGTALPTSFLLAADVGSVTFV